MVRTLFFALALFHGLSASALTMTFDEIGQALQSSSVADKTYTENGITASTSGSVGLGYWGPAGTLHLDDSGTSIASTVNFTGNGRFSAVSFDLFPLGQTAMYFDLTNSDLYPDPSWEIVVRGSPYDNVRVSGFRSGALVAEDNFYSGNFPTYFFDTIQFADIDNLIISAQRPTVNEIESIGAALLASHPGYRLGSAYCDEAPCAHFDIDNLVLDPVAAIPLPGSLPLVAVGLISLGIARRLSASDVLR